MEELDILDSPDRNRKVIKKNLLTTSFLAVSTISIFLLLVLSNINPSFFGIQVNHIEINLLLAFVAFLFALAGFIMGFTEWSYNRRKATIGIIGNGLILIFYALYFLLPFFLLPN